MHKRWRNVLIAILAIVLVGLFFWLIDVPALIATLRNANGALLLLATAVFLCGAVLFSARWRYILQRQPRLLPTFQTDSIAMMANIGLHIPASATRVVGISRVSPVSIPQATSGIVVERLYEQLMRLLALVLTIVLSVSGANQSGAILSGLVFLALAMLAIYLLIRNQDRVVPALAHLLGRLPRLKEERVRAILEDMLSELSAAATPRQLLAGLLLSVSVWAFFYLYHYLTLVALNTGLPQGVIAGMAMLVLAVAPPSAPAMFGIYHGVVITSLSLAWPGDLSVATAYALVLHAIQMILWSVLGLWGLTQVDFKLDELLQAVRQGSKDQESEPA